MLKELRRAISSFLLLTLLTGIAYPLLVTGISQLVMPGKANGSLIMKDGKPVGSSLIGQSFSGPKYFWSRPSATSPMPNNASSSSGSNLGPTNPALADTVKTRVQALRDADPGNQQPVPVDLVTASGSGLDPHVSPAAAVHQLARVTRVRNLNSDTLRKLVAEHTEDRQFGILGEPRVNVLELNLALDALR
jgi:potassium-transporting ATPase KdpC subunit